MKKLGLGALSHAVWHALYDNGGDDKWSELSVLQAAHAAEILIKARIVQEHPLLIFVNLPLEKKSTNELLNLRQLLKDGKTIEYSNLPNLLWASTGIKTPNLKIYEDFGKLRNMIQHFSSPDVGTDCTQKTIEFIFSVIDPLINKFWGLYAVDFIDGDVSYNELMNKLLERNIDFLVSEEAALRFDSASVNWSSFEQNYQIEMQKRIDYAIDKSTPKQKLDALNEKKHLEKILTR
ncbi:MAG: hypothetical protein Q8N30_17790 [Methylococcales bacterium]|nr:hypothetical protein [Methylococcales bacterium]